MPPPVPTPVYRLVHVDNLHTLLTRGALYAPKHTPDDGLPYRTIHDPDVQLSRANYRIRCGPTGTAHDYVPFYFGPLSPMLLKLKTGQVAGYDEGQEPLVYLVITAQRVAAGGARFVFSDGHGLAKFTDWFDDLGRLDMVDWNMVGARYWSDKPEDNDRQRRKQAEFLVWQQLDWAFIERIGVATANMKTQVEAMLQVFPSRHQPPVEVCSNWYYY